MRSVVLLSGGLDSTTCLYLARSRQEVVCALSFTYGQLSIAEVACADNICQKSRVPHQVVALPKALFLSSLTGTGSVPTADNIIQDRIPSTYVPARNLVFLSLATAFAESHGCQRMYLGANCLDFSGYPDCRPVFIEAMQRTIDVATKAGGEHGLEICTPLLHFGKTEIVELAMDLNVPLELTMSCYQPVDGRSCGTCDSCLLRAKGFQAAKVTDPVAMIGSV